MLVRTTLVEQAPGGAEKAFYNHGMEPNESMTQLQDVLARHQI